ncbi:MAG: tRNA (adenosine(37)-N6)-dimethylallyltransferase MiaA [Actinobacteria bacterium]|nr:tRNA (adenosine(37)-N6)-dimethylallyltransferase MiaA [Actinomycetota bacterium]
MRTIALLGPTASGKSAVALAVAERNPSLELVSIDAMQVYRGLDIGTAKPSADERARVPHHLIDIVGPSDEFTVARFQREYRAVRADIASRDRHAILVGGTGLYARAAIDELDIPGQWPAVRARLEREVDEVGAANLHRRLATLDPVAATKMEPTNARRIVRALEVIEGSGRAFSSFGPGVDTYPESDVVQIALRWPRDVLSRRIEERVDAMLAAGWLDEVRALESVPKSRTAAAALGYEELHRHLSGEWSLERAREEIVIRTRQFAVRQERWFRRDPRVEWIDIESDPVGECVALVESRLT